MQRGAKANVSSTDIFPMPYSAPYDALMAVESSRSSRCACVSTKYGKYAQEQRVRVTVLAPMLLNMPLGLSESIRVELSVEFHPPNTTTTTKGSTAAFTLAKLRHCCR